MTVLHSNGRMQPLAVRAGKRAFEGDTGLNKIYSYTYQCHFMFGHRIATVTAAILDFRVLSKVHIKQKPLNQI